jgi:hypothetical protein
VLTWHGIAGAIALAAAPATQLWTDAFPLLPLPLQHSTKAKHAAAAAAGSACINLLEQLKRGYCGSLLYGATAAAALEDAHRRGRCCN